MSNVKIISDNAVEAVAKSESFKDKLIDLWINACMSVELDAKNMSANFRYHGNWYDEKDSIWLLIQFADGTPELLLYKKVSSSQNPVEFYEVDLADNEISFFQRLNRNWFDKKYTRTVEANRTCTYTSVYSLICGSISTVITEEKFNNLSDFYFEQRYTKILNCDLEKLSERFQLFNVSLLNS